MGNRIQKINKEFAKIQKSPQHFQFYLMHLERALGQSSSEYQFLVKQNDEDYKIYMIRGILSFDILNDCINLQKEIEDDFKIMFQDFEKRENSDCELE